MKYLENFKNMKKIFIEFKNRVSKEKKEETFKEIMSFYPGSYQLENIILLPHDVDIKNDERILHYDKFSKNSDNVWTICFQDGTNSVEALFSTKNSSVCITP